MHNSKRQYSYLIRLFRKIFGCGINYYQNMFNIVKITIKANKT